MTIDKLILHDRRVIGTVSLSDWPSLYMVDADTPIKHCISRIAYRAKAQGSLNGLDIMCHGRLSSNSGDGKACLPKVSGGFGLLLCRENLTLSNVGLTGEWKSLFKRITVYACAAADTGPGNENTRADGMRLCGELAIWTGAEVIASVEIQRYQYTKSVMHYLLHGGIKFGDWEGNVYRFDPQTGQATPWKP